MSHIIERAMAFRIAIIGALFFALPISLWIDSELDDPDPSFDIPGDDDLS